MSALWPLALLALAAAVNVKVVMHSEAEESQEESTLLPFVRSAAPPTPHPTALLFPLIYRQAHINTNFKFGDKWYTWATEQRPDGSHTTNYYVCYDEPKHCDDVGWERTESVPRCAFEIESVLADDRACLNAFGVPPRHPAPAPAALCDGAEQIKVSEVVRACGARIRSLWRFVRVGRRPHTATKPADVNSLLCEDEEECFLSLEYRIHRDRITFSLHEPTRGQTFKSVLRRERAHDEAPERPRERVRPPDDLLERPRERVRAPDDLPERPRNHVRVPEDLPERPRKHARAPDDLMERPRERVRAPEDLPERPRKHVRAPDDLMERPRERVRAPEDLPERPRKHVRAPDDLMERPRERVRAPDDLPERPRKHVRAPDDLLKRSRERVRAPDDLPEQPKKHVRAPDDLMEGPRERLRAPDDLPERPKKLDRAADYTAERPRVHVSGPEEPRERSHTLDETRRRHSHRAPEEGASYTRRTTDLHPHDDVSDDISSDGN